MRDYAAAHADRWFILSAKYGLVYPDQVIEPYEQTLKEMRASARRDWARHVHGQMAEAGLVSGRPRFLWLAGRAYQLDLGKHLDRFEQHDPLAGLKIGERLRWLTEALASPDRIP